MQYIEDATAVGASVPAADTLPDAKAVATLQARAALAGFELVQLADSTFLVSRWGMAKHLPDGSAVQAFLRQVGAPA